MKKCRKCGVVQKNENTLCVQCGTALPAPMNEEEEKNEQREISARIGELSEHTDAFYVSPARRVMGIISFCGAAVSFAWWLIFNLSDGYAEYISFVLVAVLMFLNAGFALLFPRTAWKISHFGDLWKYDVELSPSDLYVSVNRFICKAMFGAGVFMLACALFMMMGWI